MMMSDDNYVDKDNDNDLNDPGHREDDGVRR